VERPVIVARGMRHAPTSSEQAVWRWLRREFPGVVFRRQLVIGEDIVDLAAPALRVGIEVDGGTHVGREQQDARRDRRLEEAG
jgi:type I restriction enzyme R subunit